MDRIVAFLRARLRDDQRGRASEAGFTLVELLVVMVILVLLAGLVAPRVMGYLSSSRTKTAKVQTESLSTSLELFKLDVGRYPNEREGLAALVARPGNAANWNGPYLQKDKLPADPWGKPYSYRFPGRGGRFEIWSLGADGQEGGHGEDQDVASWM
jgi:general secretion pathway protein G